MSSTNRNFKLAIAFMLQKAKTYRQHFVNRKATFVAFDADFADPFAADWQTAIDAAEAQDTDETRDDQLQTETAQVNAELLLAQKKYIEAKYFITKAFEATPTVMNEFGVDTYSDIRSSQMEMIPFMQNLWDKCENKYKTQMLAAGYTQTKIDEIQTIKNALDSENQEQEIFKDETPLATSARNTIYNTCWEFAQKVNRAAHVIYADDFDTLNLFLFPPSDAPAETFSVLGLVTDAATGLPLADVQIEVLTTPNLYTTLPDGLYGFVLADGVYDVSFKKTGYVTQILSVTVVSGSPVTLDVHLAV